MADISKIKLPDNSEYDISVYANHIKPIQSKTFTDVIGTANNWANATFFFGSIKPTTWNATWRIKYKINVYVPNHTNYCQMAIVTVTGRQGVLSSYSSFNTIGEYYVCYYHELYRLTSAGFTNGYGHSLGTRFYSAYAPIDTGYKRTIEVDILETKNCTFSFYNSCFKYSEIPGTGSTNYNTYSEMDFVNNGLRETGDDNDVNYYNRSYYGSRTTKNALYRYQFCVTDSTGQLIPMNSVNNSVATNKTLMTDSFDPFGEIFFWVSMSTYSAGANVGNGYWYRQYLCDLRYSFNCGGYDTDPTLTARLPLYLVCSPQTDGTVKLHSSPLSQSLPASDDGLLYIYLGRVYEDTKPYRVVLTFNHPVYWYKNGAIRQYTQYAADALKVNSHTVNKDVPSDAKFTDTTYESKAAASGGTAVSLVTTGEKYTWNNKSTVPTNHATSATTYGAGSSSNYGHVKLSDSTSSTSGTSGGIAATPSAVKTAYDLANIANGKANEAYSLGTGALIYDQTYSVSNGIATFVPHVYQGGQEITTSYAKGCFVWKARLLNTSTSPVTISEVTLTTKNDRSCDVTLSAYGYGVTIKGEFTPT